MSIPLEAHSSNWGAMFAEARAELASTGVFDWIEHIGSTSVPQLVAKPIIDIMGGVRSAVSTDALVAAVREVGYVHRPGDFVDRETFRRDGPSGERTHHLHVVPASATEHQDILFRDRLRRDADRRLEYEVLKLRLATEHAGDRDRRGYSAGKTDFIQRVVDAERAERGLPVGAPVAMRNPPR